MRRTITFLLTVCALVFSVGSRAASFEICAPTDPQNFPQGFVITEVKPTTQCGTVSKMLVVSTPEPNQTACNGYQLSTGFLTISTFFPDLPDNFVITQRTNSALCDSNGDENAFVINTPSSGQHICAFYQPVSGLSQVTKRPDLPDGFVVTQTFSSTACKSADNGTLRIDALASGLAMCAGYSGGLGVTVFQFVPDGYVVTSSSSSSQLCMQGASAVIELPQNNMNICLSYRIGSSRIFSNDIPSGFATSQIFQSPQCENVVNNTATIISLTPPNEPPVAAFSFTGEQKVFQTITFNAGASFDPEGSGLTYTWDFGDGTTHTGTSPLVTHEYQADGVYPVSLIVNDGALNSSPATMHITIEGNNLGWLPAILHLLLNN